jgi:acylphosphatase
MAVETESTQIRAHVQISGRVQGVSFRWNTRHRAQQLGLTGWVRNTWDGRVEAVFEGTEEAVKQAVTWCRRGERPARVDDVNVVYSQATGEFGYFRITF